MRRNVARKRDVLVDHGPDPRFRAYGCRRAHHHDGDLRSDCISTRLHVLDEGYVSARADGIV